MSALGFMEGILRDVRAAWRTIRAKPGFSVPVLLSIGLGVGANVAIFAVVNAVLIRPLPYPEPESLVGVFNSAVLQGEAITDMPLSLGMYRAYGTAARTFRQFGVWTPGAATVSGGGDPEQVAAVTMTHGVLPALGIRPHLGQWFSNEDDSQGAPETAILSYGYWQRRFGGDGQVLGRSILIDFVPRQIIGVMPRTFHFLNLAPDVFLPERPPTVPLGSADEFNHSGIARLAPGVTLEQANAEVARALSIWRDGEGIRRVADQFRFTPTLRPLKRDVVGNVAPVLGMLMGAAIALLLLISANVANLVQVRVQSRGQELAIRAALGAGQGRIARELLIESLALGGLGGALGLGLASAGLRFAVARASAALPRLSELSLDSRAIGFGLCCAVGSSLLFGLVAVLNRGRHRPIANVRGTSATRDQLRGHDVLVVAQVSLALMLLIAAGLIGRSFVALRAVAPGFVRPDEIQTVRLAIPAVQVPEPDRVARMQADLVARILTLPGVTAAGYGSGLPMELDHHNGFSIAVEGQTPNGEIAPNRTTKRVSPGLFATLGTRFLAGRDFTWTDLFDQRRVAIVSENMAREHWGEASTALGKRIRAGNDGPWTEIVGVVENVYDDGADRPAPPIVYFPAGVIPASPGAAPAVGRGITIAVRSKRAGTEGLFRDLTTAIHAVSPDLPLAKVRTLNEVYRGSMARTSFALVLLGVAGTTALMLAIGGVFGVLAYGVAQRRREVMIRLALGAEPAVIRARFLRQGAILAATGGAIGLVAAGGLSRWMASLLFGVSRFDPITYGTAAAIIVGSALAASYLPARRAAGLDPMEALRND